MRVLVIRAWPRRADRVELDLPDGATVSDAIVASGYAIHEHTPVLTGQAVFGDRVEPTYVLRDGDRLELLRPLEIDPKQARRLRAIRAGR